MVEQLQGNAVDLSKMALGEGGTDVGKVVEWMRSIPSTLTRLKIDVPNASAEVVDALHSLVAKTTTLAELDAMEGSASKLNVLQLNGTEKVKEIHGKDGEPFGPLSAAIIAACVQRNPVLESLECAARLSRAFLSAPIDTSLTWQILHSPCAHAFEVVCSRAHAHALVPTQSRQQHVG